MANLRCAKVVFQGREVEIVVAARKDLFELWLVTSVRGVRTVCTHYLTNDDLESHLSYSERRPLLWNDYSIEELPSARTRHVTEWERRVRPGKITSFKKLSYHFAALPSWERKAVNAARRRIVGTWAKSGFAMQLKPGGAADSSGLSQRSCHSLQVAAAHDPNRWWFDAAGLHLQNSETKAGSWVRVIYVDDVELHLLSLNRNRIADVLTRC